MVFKKNRVKIKYNFSKTKLSLVKLNLETDVNQTKQLKRKLPLLINFVTSQKNSFSIFVLGNLPS